jgi:hypothetical protein
MSPGLCCFGQKFRFMGCTSARGAIPVLEGTETVTYLLVGPLDISVAAASYGGAQRTEEMRQPALAADHIRLSDCNLGTPLFDIFWRQFDVPIF